MINKIITAFSSPGFLGTLIGAFVTIWATKSLEKKKLRIEQARLLTNEITAYLTCLKQFDNVLGDFKNISPNDKEQKQKKREKLDKKIEEVQLYQYRIDIMVYTEDKKHPLFKIHNEMTDKVRIEIGKMDGFFPKCDEGVKLSNRKIDAIINDYLLKTNQFLNDALSSFFMKNTKRWHLNKCNKAKK